MFVVYKGKLSDLPDEYLHVLYLPVYSPLFMSSTMHAYMSARECSITSLQVLYCTCDAHTHHAWQVAYPLFP